MTTRILYDLTAYHPGSDRNYRMLEVDLWIYDDDDHHFNDISRGSDWIPHVFITWQRETKPAKALDEPWRITWYATHIKIDTPNLDHINEIVKGLKRIARQLLKDYNESHEFALFEYNTLKDTTPESLLAALEKIRARRVVYDPRLSNFTYQDDLAPPEWQLYTPEPESVLYNYQTTAPDEPTARMNIIKLMTEADNQRRANDDLETWTGNNLEVKRWNRSEPDPVNYQPAQEIIDDGRAEFIAQLKAEMEARQE